MASGKLRRLDARIWQVALAALASAAIAVFACGVSASRSVPLPVPSGLADGDIVFRTGRDIQARLVLTQGEAARFSHVGIVVRKEAGIFVVHAAPHDALTPGGVVIEPLSLFMSPDRAADIGFYRPKHLGVGAREKIRAFALGQLGKPFDDSFLFSDDAAFYCTELVLKALAAGGIDAVGHTQSVMVIALTEPVFPPDYLRRSVVLSSIK